MKKYWLIAFFASAVMQTKAQFKAPVNEQLKTYIQQSFSYFPRIQEAENAVVTAAEKVELASIRTPEISLSGNYTYMAPVAKVPFPVNGETKEIQFQPNHNYTGGLNASYTLFDFGRLAANVNKAKQDLQFSKDNAASARMQLAYQVANIWYNIVYYKKAIAIQDSIIASLQESKNLTDIKLKNGDALRIDLLNLQAGINNELNRKVDLENNLQRQINLLHYSTGLSADITTTAFDFAFVYNDTAAAFTAARSGNPDYILAMDRIKQATADIAIAKLHDKPTVSVGATTGIRNGYQPDIAVGRFNYTAGVSLNVPIYSGGKIKKQVQIAENMAKQNQLAYNTTDATVKKDIRQALIDIDYYQQRLQNVNEQILAARTAEQLAKSRYKNGAATNIEITNAAANVEKVLFTELQYQYQLTLARLELARLTGLQIWL